MFRNNMPPDPTDRGMETETVSKRIREYPKDHTGPFTVYIRELKTKINPLNISMQLHKNYNGIVKCETFRQKLKITLANREQANAIPRDKVFAEYAVYIPSDEVEVTGVISLPTEDILDTLLTVGKGKFNNSYFQM